MVDGPFRHTSLPNSWKRFGKFIANKPMSKSDRSKELSKILEKDLLPKSLKAGVNALRNNMSKIETHLFPGLAVAAILSGVAPCAQLDLMQRHLLVHLGDQLPPLDAITHALNDTFRDGIEDYRERIEVHCLEAENKFSYENLQTNSNDAFAEVNPEHFTKLLLEPELTSIQIIEEVDWPVLTK